jgi:hypothetical protein
MVSGSISASTPACHAGERGSTPRQRDYFFHSFTEYSPAAFSSSPIHSYFSLFPLFIDPSARPNWIVQYPDKHAYAIEGPTGPRIPPPSHREMFSPIHACTITRASGRCSGSVVKNIGRSSRGKLRLRSTTAFEFVQKRTRSTMRVRPSSLALLSTWLWFPLTLAMWPFPPKRFKGNALLGAGTLELSTDGRVVGLGDFNGDQLFVSSAPNALLTVF